MKKKVAKSTQQPADDLLSPDDKPVAAFATPGLLEEWLADSNNDTRSILVAACFVMPIVP